VRDTDPTEAERRFVDALQRAVPDVLDWYHVDDGGTLWMTVSVDVSRDGAVGTTWRCDWDGRRLLGGRSPGFLNWDDGVRARDAGVQTSPPEGLDADADDPETAATIAARWFAERLSTGA
jgi:hypothetical protein